MTTRVRITHSDNSCWRVRVRICDPHSEQALRIDEAEPE